MAADVRGFFAELGVDLPTTSAVNVLVQCFSNRSAHKHGDANPSCSVNVENGLWQCWACGAKGNPYLAAIARAYTPKEAFALLTKYGLNGKRRRGSEGS